MDDTRRAELLAKTALGRHALGGLAGTAAFSGGPAKEPSRDSHGHYGEAGDCGHGHGASGPAEPAEPAGPAGPAGPAKLGKAHKALLEAALASHHGVVSVLSGVGKGAKGGLKSHLNARQREAAARLVELGLMERIGGHDSTEVKSGNVMHWKESHYRLTARGREAAQGLADSQAVFGDGGKDADGCHWVTISGGAGTTHICIGEGGTIEKGPAGLVGKDKDALDEPPAKAGEKGGGGGTKAERDRAVKDKPPARQEPRDFKSPSDSKTLQDQVSGKSSHELFNGRVGGAARDTMLEALMHESGRGGHPRTVTAGEMDELQKQGWMISYRGHSKQQYADNLKGGELYGSSGIYGNGIYVQKEQEGFWPALGFGKGREAAIKEAKVYGEHVVKIALPPTARVVNLSDIQEQQRQYQAELGRQCVAGKLPIAEYQKHMDVVADLGRFATLKNYDAIYCDWGGYHSVLNRSILAVQDKNL